MHHSSSASDHPDEALAGGEFDLYDRRSGFTSIGDIMDRQLRIRSAIEIGLAVMTAVTFVVTLISAEWIERLTGWEPDGGSGELEWMIAGAFLVAAIVFASMGVRTDRRRRALAVS